MSSNGSFRKREKPFVMICHTVARDENLSFKAKGLYLLIESYLSIPDWTLYKDFLMSKSKEGRDAFNSAWKELKDKGYLKQTKTKSEEGKWIYVYDLLETPIIDPKPEEINIKEPEINDPTDQIPDTENPYVGKTGVENSGVENTPLYNNNEYNNNKYNNNNKKNRKEKIKENTETEHSISDLSDKTMPNKSMPKIPHDCIEYLDPYFVKRFIKDRTLYDLDFNDIDLYTILLEAIVKTQVQDNVEVLTIRQYPYFYKTLKNMLAPIQRKIDLTKLIAADYVKFDE